jgi:hypothetical protein
VHEDLLRGLQETKMINRCRIGKHALLGDGEQKVVRELMTEAYVSPMSSGRGGSCHQAVPKSRWLGVYPA